MFERIFKKFNKKECDTKNNGVILNEYEASQGNNRHVEQSDLRLFANDCEQYKAGYPTGQEAQMLFLHRHSEALAEESRTRKGSFGFYPQDDGKRKSAFTLTEAIVVLTILGIIAALSIPGILQNQRNAAERTKLKKVIVDFEKLISNMTIENDIQSIDALEEYANTTDCPNSRKYFKINKENDSSDLTVSGHGKCVFRATDGVWWDISDITRPVVSLDGIDKLSNIDGQNAFLLTTTFNDDAKAFVVNDVNSPSLSSTQKSQLQKTLDFVENKSTTTASNNNDEPTEEDTTKKNSPSDELQNELSKSYFNHCGETTPDDTIEQCYSCSSCYITGSNEEFSGAYYYDTDGKLIQYLKTTHNNDSGVTKMNIYQYDYDNTIYQYVQLNSNGYYLSLMDCTDEEHCTTCSHDDLCEQAKNSDGTYSTSKMSDVLSALKE